MRQLEEAIKAQGIGIGSDIVKVDMFLNHRIDTALLFNMGQAVAKHFAIKQPDVVLTVESSGIALAVSTAFALGNIPVVFAKKAKAANQDTDMLTAPVYSFTHKKENIIRIAKHYLPKGSRVLIVDDFLANGQAVHGLTKLIEQADCTLCGVAVAIEKGFQPGGSQLRAQGIDVLSLAIVSGIKDGVIELAPQAEEASSIIEY